MTDTVRLLESWPSGETNSSNIQLSSKTYSDRNSPRTVRDSRIRQLGVLVLPIHEDVSTTKSAGSINSEPDDFNQREQNVRREGSGAKLAGCRRMCSQRTPKGKGFLLVFTLIMIERYVFTGAVNGVLRLIPEFAGSSFTNNASGLVYFFRITLLYCSSRLFYPVAGFFADVYFGRYKVIHISLWLYWVAFALLAIGNTLCVISERFDPIHDYIAPIISYLCIILASGGFQSTIIPFGADQLEAASSSELSSYFYWYYLAVQAGGFVNILVDTGTSALLPSFKHMDLFNGITQALIALTLVSLALILHKSLEHWYFKNALRENCIKLVWRVVWYAATAKRHMPQYRRAFRYGEERVSRIELAKQQYDGKYSQNEVEDVKTFCRICLVLFAFSGFFFALPGGYAMLSYRLNNTLSVSTTDSMLAKALFPNAFILINTLTVSLSLPLVNHILVPCVRSITIKEKIGIGMAITVVAVGSGAYMEWALSDATPLQQALSFILPTVLLSIQESFTFVSVLEFIYAQSPESMKGMLTGLTYFLSGLLSGGVSAAFFVFVESSSYNSPVLFASFYLILCAYAVLGFISYVVVACLYTNRQRPMSEREADINVKHLYNTFLPS